MKNCNYAKENSQREVGQKLESAKQTYTVWEYTLEYKYFLLHYYHF